MASRVGAGDAPAMTPLCCSSCGTRVLVRKSSQAQTTVQWLSNSGGCPELAARRAAGQDTGRVARCDRLWACLDEAVVAGLIPVLE